MLRILGDKPYEYGHSYIKIVNALMPVLDQMIVFAVPHRGVKLTLFLIKCDILTVIPQRGYRK